jgi:hypothetical protein
MNVERDEVMRFFVRLAFFEEALPAEFAGA